MTDASIVEPALPHTPKAKGPLGALYNWMMRLAAGNKADAQAAFNTSVSGIDRIADKGIVHKNKAARHKSRLSAAVKAIA